MPTLYEYFGLFIYFYSDDHLPIHVHAEYAERSCKVEFIINEGKAMEFKFHQINNRPLLRRSEEKKLRELLNFYSDDVIKKWSMFHILKQQIKPIKITKKIK